MDDEELEILEMLIASVEADLVRKDEDAMVARSTEAWLLSLRENLAGVEKDTEEVWRHGVSSRDCWWRRSPWPAARTAGRGSRSLTGSDRPQLR